MDEVVDPVMTEADARVYIGNAMQQAEEVRRQGMLGHWELYTTGSHTASERADREARAFYTDPALSSTLELCYDIVTDPELTENINYLYNRTKVYTSQADNENAIDAKAREAGTLQMSHRATYQGAETTDQAMDKVLETETEVALRKEAWCARNAKGDAAASSIVELVKLRNAYAREQGHANYYEMCLEEEGYDPKGLYEFLEEVDSDTAASYSQKNTERKAELAVAFGISVDDLRPWHFGLDTDGLTKEIDAYFPEGKQMKMLERSYTDMGFDLKGLGITYDTDPRPGKSQHCFAMGISMPDDVRVLANKEATYDFQQVLHHESGHAIYYAGMDQKLPFYDRGAPTNTMNEAVPMLMEQVCSTAQWLEEYAGVPAELAARVEADNLWGEERSIRKILSVAAFERRLYENPDQDLVALWWELKERYEGIPKPDDTSVNAWAALPHFIDYPAYYQDYLMASMAASQLRDTIEAETGSVQGNPKTAEFLREKVFAPGQSTGETEIMEGATGEEVNTQAYFEWVYGAEEDSI